MTVHQLPLGGVERARLAEDAGIEMDLAHVVQHPGQGKAVELDFAEPDADAEVHGEIGDPMHVTVQVLDHVLHDLDQYVSWKFPHYEITRWGSLVGGRRLGYGPNGLYAVANLD